MNDTLKKGDEDDVFLLRRTNKACAAITLSRTARRRLLIERPVKDDDFCGPADTRVVPFTSSLLSAGALKKQ
jgi:hypothetical protein